MKKLLGLVVLLVFLLFPVSAAAAETSALLPAISIDIGSETSTGDNATLQLMFLLVFLTLLPTLLLMVTSFTRIIISLHFLRAALGTQQMPPNQVLIGLALAMTLFLMSPIITDVNENAFIPYSAGEITTEQAIELGMEPIREFMLGQVRTEDLALFASFAGEQYTAETVPEYVLIPAFILGEITRGFQFGFLIYMPFIVVDMVVASTLMAMGMMMLPPAMISLPFKLLLFILGDGWNLTIQMLMNTFR